MSAQAGAFTKDVPRNAKWGARGAFYARLPMGQSG